MTEPDLKVVDRAVEKIGRKAHDVIEILQTIQDHYRYLPEDAMRRLCEISDITPASIAGISTFYTQFRHRPVGRHMISVCHGTACHVKGAGLVTDALKRALNLKEGEDTDKEGLFTLQKVACLGCCTLAPAVKIDDITFGHITANKAGDMLEDFLEMKKKAAVSSEADQKDLPTGFDGELRIGLGSCCISRGSGKLRRAIDEAVVRSGVKARIKRVGCVGMCHQTPLLEVVLPKGESFLYAQVEPEDAEPIILKHFKSSGFGQKIRGSVRSAIDYLLTGKAHDSGESRFIHKEDEPVAAFLDKQKNIATSCCGEIDPTDIDEYLTHSGFNALKLTLGENDPEGVIDKICASGLRGRGGAGYPTSRKWSLVKNAPGDEKYIICNGDEGDPGAFMDRMLLESYPYRIIEGMAIAAFAVGASKGYFYIRGEYPLAVSRVREALDICRERGFIGDRIFGSAFSFDLKVKLGAGAFVCGEETALIASIEGGRGNPRLRPPYPAEAGLFQKPTLVNNVETLALVPAVIGETGGEDFAELGTEKSRGTKVFALAGKVDRGGLIEVPMGITLRDIVEGIGGGVAGGKQFKAVQVGGPSGGCVPEKLADAAVDYESLTKAGAIMGSGGLVVLDEDDCMVDMARYFLEFTRDQSCGKCAFCRIGTMRMLDILEDLCAGRAGKGALEELEQLGRVMKAGSLCGLGKTAPNPVLSTLIHFKDEYEAHLEGRCPAGRCRELINYSVTDKCIGCTLCAQNCPTGAIAMNPYDKHEIRTEYCVRCGGCRDLCPRDAIEVK